ncbi:MAG: DUF4126 domain-containing protein [Gemmatimonadetes bacterium]|nr:DUF4126 domain-containing protein [Gemmatimonadota bacterium]
MTAAFALAQALALAYAGGISVYATVALLGIFERWGWVSGVASPLDAARSPWVIGLAFTLTVVEFVATLVPGLASAWEAVHSVIRPPAAAALAVLVAWHGDASLILAAGLLGGALGLATHATKLGVRVAIDTSPEPVTNFGASVAELTMVAGIVAFAWRHPVATLGVALAMWVGVLLLVRTVWRTMRRAVAS